MGRCYAGAMFRKNSAGRARKGYARTKYPAGMGGVLGGSEGMTHSRPNDAAKVSENASIPRDEGKA
jgi:hypothetical protein